MEIFTWAQKNNSLNSYKNSLNFENYSYYFKYLSYYFTEENYPIHAGRAWLIGKKRMANPVESTVWLRPGAQSPAVPKSVRAKKTFVRCKALYTHKAGTPATQ